METRSTRKSNPTDITHVRFAGALVATFATATGSGCFAHAHFAPLTTSVIGLTCIFENITDTVMAFFLWLVGFMSTQLHIVKRWIFSIPFMRGLRGMNRNVRENRPNKPGGNGNG